MFIDIKIIAVAVIVFILLLVKIARLYSKIHTLQKIVHKLEIDEEEKEERFPDTETGGAEGKD